VQQASRTCCRGRAAPALQELNLSHNCLSSRCRATWQALRALVDLDLSSNEIKALPSELRALPRLALLKLTDNRMHAEAACTAASAAAAAAAGGSGGGHARQAAT
jgi:hypothetical protein